MNRPKTEVVVAPTPTETVARLYQFYRHTRIETGLPPTPERMEEEMRAYPRYLPGTPVGLHTYTSMGKAFIMGDIEWTGLNDTDKRYSEWVKQHRAVFA